MGKKERTMEYRCQFDVGIKLVYNLTAKQEFCHE